MNVSKIADVALLCLLCVFTLFLSLSFVFAPKRSFSENENRILQALPSLTLKKLTDGTYTAQLHDFLSDQIIFRDEMIAIKAKTELALGKSESNGILPTSNGYLIETSRYTDENYSHLKSNLKNIEKLSTSLRNSGINTVSALVPRKVDMPEVGLPSLYPREYAERVFSLVGNAHIDLRTALKKTEDAFYKTDHHLTASGIYEVYCVLGDELGYSPLPLEEFELQTLSEDFYGTSFSRSGLFYASADTIRAPCVESNRYTTVIDTGLSLDGLYDLSYLDKKDKYSVFLGGNSAYVKVSDNMEEKDTLLIVKDSYSHALAPFLCRHFDLCLIDPRYYNGSVEKYITENDIENVLFIFGLDTLSTAELGIR